MKLCSESVDGLCVVEDCVMMLCVLRLASCVLRLASCVLRLASCVLRLASCVLRLASCVLRVACCVLRVACCVLRVACCVLRVACCLFSLISARVVIGHLQCCLLTSYTYTLLSTNIPQPCVTPQNLIKIITFKLWIDKNWRRFWKFLSSDSGSSYAMKMQAKYWPKICIDTIVLVDALQVLLFLHISAG